VDNRTVQWRVIGWYDNRDQAVAAATYIRSSFPRAYEVAALTSDGRAVWREKSEDYGADSVRV